jgi:hypothetical protein
MRKINHPIALLRFILGKTQAQFGEVLEVSGDFIKKVELRQKKLSPQAWRTLHSLYGWRENSLDMPLADPTDPAAVGRMINAQWELYEAWRWRSVVFNADAPDAFERLFRPVIVDLIKKAQRKERAVALLLSLENWIRNAAKHFKLGEVPLKMYARGDSGDLRHSSGGFPIRPGFQLPPMPEYIQRATAAYRDSLGSKANAAAPKKLGDFKRDYRAHAELAAKFNDLEQNPNPAAFDDFIGSIGLAKKAAKAKGKAGGPRASRKPRRA